MRIPKDDFAQEQHWKQHRLLLQIPDCRVYDQGRTATAMLLFYAIGLHDYKFMARYPDEGPADLYVMTGNDLDRLAEKVGVKLTLETRLIAPSTSDTEKS